MIIRYTENGWEVITQRNHGLLAAEICARWKISDQPSRWVETLIACAEHDDAFNELDSASLLTDTGGPLNFDMCVFDEKASQALIDMAITKSYFVALLIARHIAFTHGSEPTAKKFIKGLKKQERTWLKVANTTTAEIERAYQLLELCDAFSLLICQNILQPEERSMEISNGPGGTKYYVVVKDDNLKVTPWPFELDTFSVSYEVRHIPQLVFKNDAEFKKILGATYPKRITLNISKSL